MYLRTNVLDEICRQKIHGLNKVPEIHCFNKEWEWYDELEWFTLNTVVYDNEFLKEDIERISVTFFENKGKIDIYMSVFYLKLMKHVFYFMLVMMGRIRN